MNAHLSDEQFTRYLAGEEDSRAQAHLAECEGCRAQASSLLHVVGVSRAHAERSGERHPNQWARQRSEVRDALKDRRTHRPAWALASAFALLVVLSTFMFHTQTLRNQPVIDAQISHPAFLSDEALLSTIDSTLQQSVPSALAPLQELAYEREQAERNQNGKN